jgi:hypothetical protein
VNVHLGAGCGPLTCSIAVPVTGTETAAKHCEDLAQAIRGSACAANSFVVVSDQCASTRAAFAVSVACGSTSMVVGVSAGSNFSPFDQTYLGPLSDGESDTIVAGPPPAAPVPALSTRYVVGILLALGAAGLLLLRRLRAPLSSGPREL